MKIDRTTRTYNKKYSKYRIGKYMMNNGARGYKKFHNLGDSIAILLISLLFFSFSCGAMPYQSDLIDASFTSSYNVNDLFLNSNCLSAGIDFLLLFTNFNLNINYVNEDFFKKNVINNIEYVGGKAPSGMVPESKFVYDYNISGGIWLLNLLNNHVGLGYRYHNVFNEDSILRIGKDPRLFQSHSVFLTYNMNFWIIGFDAHAEYTFLMSNIKDVLTIGLGGYVTPMSGIKISFGGKYIRDIKNSNFNKHDLDDGILSMIPNIDQSKLWGRKDNVLFSIDRKLLLREFYELSLDTRVKIAFLIDFIADLRIQFHTNGEKAYIIGLGIGGRI